MMASTLELITAFFFDNCLFYLAKDEFILSVIVNLIIIHFLGINIMYNATIFVRRMNILISQGLKGFWDLILAILVIAVYTYNISDSKIKIF